MEREEIRERLMDLVDGTLSPDEARRVEEEIRRFPDLEQELSDLREAVALAGKLSGVDVPADLSAGIRRAIDGCASSRRSRVVPLWIFGAAAAAVLVLALGISILRELGPGPDRVRSERQVATRDPRPNEPRSRAILPTERDAKQVGKAESKELVAEEIAADKDGVPAARIVAREKAEGADRKPEMGSPRKEKKRASGFAVGDSRSAHGASGEAPPSGAEPPAAPAPAPRKPAGYLDDGKSPAPTTPGCRAGRSPGSKGPERERTEADGEGDGRTTAPDRTAGAAARKGRARGMSREAPAEGKDDAIPRDAGEGLGLKGARESRKRKPNVDRFAAPGRGDLRDEALRRPPRMARIALATFEVERARATRAREAIVQFLQQANVSAQSWSAKRRVKRDVNEVSIELRLTSEQVRALEKLLVRHGKLTVAPSRETVPDRQRDAEAARVRGRIFASLAKGRPAPLFKDAVDALDRREPEKGKVRPAPTDVGPGDARSQDAGKAVDAPRAPASPEAVKGDDRAAKKAPSADRTVEPERKDVRLGEARRESEGPPASGAARPPAGERGGKQAPAPGLAGGEPGGEPGKKPAPKGALSGRRTSEEARPAGPAGARARMDSGVHYWLLVIRTR